MLRRLIVTQGDTEPASRRAAAHARHTAPSIYDLRNLFQVNVEEGRHLWAMVYLLHSQFGRDGREEAEELLAAPQRQRRQAAHPRRLQRSPMDNWLDFFMFTMFTDRDGKYQLLALAESGFDPLARTTRFMLTEEAHHMFVGETGVERIVQRTAELMKHGPERRRDAQQGGIALDMIQRLPQPLVRALRSTSSAARSRATRRPSSRTGLKGPLQGGDVPGPPRA